MQADFVAHRVARADDALQLLIGQTAIEGEAHQRAVLRRCRRKERRAEQALRFQRVAQLQQALLRSRFEGDDLRVAGLHVVAHFIQVHAYVVCAGVQALAAPGVVLDYLQRGVESGHFVR